MVPQRCSGPNEIGVFGGLGAVRMYGLVRRDGGVERRVMLEPIEDHVAEGLRRLRRLVLQRRPRRKQSRREAVEHRAAVTPTSTRMSRTAKHVTHALMDVQSGHRGATEVDRGRVCEMWTDLVRVPDCGEELMRVSAAKRRRVGREMGRRRRWDG